MDKSRRYLIAVGVFLVGGPSYASAPYYSDECTRYYVGELPAGEMVMVSAALPYGDLLYGHLLIDGESGILGYRFHGGRDERLDLPGSTKVGGFESIVFDSFSEATVSGGIKRRGAQEDLPFVASMSESPEAIIGRHREGAHEVVTYRAQLSPEEHLLSVSVDGNGPVPLAVGGCYYSFEWGASAAALDRERALWVFSAETRSQGTGGFSAQVTAVYRLDEEPALLFWAATESGSGGGGYSSGGHVDVRMGADGIQVGRSFTEHFGGYYSEEHVYTFDLEDDRLALKEVASRWLAGPSGNEAVEIEPGEVPALPLFQEHELSPWKHPQVSVYRTGPE